MGVYSEACRLIAVEIFVSSVETSLVNVYISVMSSGHVYHLAFASVSGSNHLCLSRMRGFKYTNF